MGREAAPASFRDREYPLSSRIQPNATAMGSSPALGARRRAGLSAEPTKVMATLKACCALLLVASASAQHTRKEAKVEIMKVLASFEDKHPLGVRWLYETASVEGPWFFNHNDGTHGSELWVSGLSPSSTRMVVARVIRMATATAARAAPPEL